MGGASRESRESEKTFKSVWDLMRGLSNCVWSPLLDSAEEDVDLIKELLDKMIKQMKEEQNETCESRKRTAQSWRCGGGGIT